MQGLILDYGATIDSGGKHWAEVLWEGYCQVSLPVTKEQFREAYVYTERYVSFTPVIRPDYNFFQLMQTRVGIQINYLLQQGMLTEDILHTTLKIISDDEMPIIDDVHDLSQYFVDVIAGYCYDYARRCTLDACRLIEKLSEKYECALVSNFYGNLAAVLQDFGLLRCFRCVIDSAIVGLRKPDPAIFQLAIDRLGLPVKDITAVGDSYSRDIAPALQLGCKGIWVRGDHPGSPDDDVDYQPAIHSIIQLYDLL